MFAHCGVETGIHRSRDCLESRVSSPHGTGAGVSLQAETSSGGYSFSPVSVRPRTKARWKTRKRNIIGIMPTTAAAIISW
jgi:hypothetical protein